MPTIPSPQTPRLTRTSVRECFGRIDSIDIPANGYVPPVSHSGRNVFAAFLFLAAIVLIGFSLSGCASAPQSIRPVLANARDAQSRLALSYAEDLKGYRRVVAANLAAQRVLIVGNVRREFIVRDYVVESNGVETANVENLRRDIADASTSTAIVEEVRLGRWTPEKAETFLRDYAALGSLSNATEARSKMIETLSRVARFDAAVREIDSSFDAHAEQVASLFSETGASLDAVATLADKPELGEMIGSRDTWSNLLGSIVRDAKKRDAILDAVTSAGPLVGTFDKR